MVPRTPLLTLEEARLAHAKASPMAAPMATPLATTPPSTLRARFPPSLLDLLVQALPNTISTGHMANLQKLWTNWQLVLKEGQEVDDWTWSSKFEVALVFIKG
jgi:hypothetical protein